MGAHSGYGLGFAVDAPDHPLTEPRSNGCMNPSGTSELAATRFQLPLFGVNSPANTEDSVVLPITARSMATAAVATAAAADVPTMTCRPRGFLLPFRFRGRPGHLLGQAAVQVGEKLFARSVVVAWSGRA